MAGAIAYGGALQCYFHGDDFLQLPFVHEALRANPFRLLEPFFGPWAPGYDYVLRFYRPLIPLTFAWDMFIGGGQAWSFHLSNLLIHIGAACAFFVMCRRILKGAVLPALAAALLFVSYPVIAEVVADPALRYDSLCALFLFCTVAAFCRLLDISPGGREGKPILAALLFVGALVSKEAAVVAPALLLALCALRGQSLSDGLRRTAPFWVITTAFFALRAATVGSAVGSYLGASWTYMLDSVFERWFVPGWFWRLALPMNENFIKPGDAWWNVFSLMVALAVGVCWLNLFHRDGFSERMRNTAFFIVGALLMLLPVTIVAYLGPGLGGGRHLYLFSAFACGAIATLLLGSVRGWRRSLALGCAGLLTICFVGTSRVNLRGWELAGMEMRTIRAELAKLVAASPSSRLPIIFANPPVDSNGAIMFFSLESVQEMLKPPFCSADLSAGVDSLERFMIMSGTHILPSALRDALSCGETVVFWDGSRLVEKPELATPLQSVVQLRPPKPRTNGKTGLLDYVWTAEDLKEIRPARGGVLEIEFAGTGFGRGDSVALLEWSGAEPDSSVSPPAVRRSRSAQTDSSSRPAQTCTPFRLTHSRIFFTKHGARCSFYLSQECQWLLSAGLHQLVVSVPEGITGRVKSARLVPDEKFVPALAIAGSSAKRAKGRVYEIDRQTMLSIDASAIDGAAGAVLQISKPGEHFDWPSRVYRIDARNESVLHEYTFPGNILLTGIPLDTLSAGTDYQLRVCAVDASGSRIGMYSDPLSVRLAKGIPERATGTGTAKELEVATRR